MIINKYTEQGCPTVALSHQRASGCQQDNTLYKLFNSGKFFQKHDQLILLNVSLPFLNRKCVNSNHWDHLLIDVFIITTELIMVVPPGDNIQTDFSHSAQQKLLCSRPIVCASRFNPSNAEPTFVQSTGTQKSLKTIQTLSCWYSLESSRRVLSYEYPFAMVSVISSGFCIILYWPN